MECKFGVVTIESPFSFVNIRKVELNAKVNEHAQLRLEGIVNQSVTEIIALNYANECIMIMLPDEQVFLPGYFLT